MSLKNSAYSLPAEAYLALAKKRQGEEQSKLYLMAAGRYIEEGALTSAEQILKITHPLTTETIDKKNLLLAKIDTLKGAVASAFNRLGQIKSPHYLSHYDELQYHELLTQLYQKTHHPIEAIEERIKIDALLTDETLKSNNHHALWLSLIQLPRSELDTLALESKPNRLVRGWATLAQILSYDADKPQTLVSHLNAWQRQYPQHPANALFKDSLSDLKVKLYPSPKQVALMLPLTGVFAGPGLAIKEGFLAAYEASGFDRFLKIKFYDTQRSEVAALYEQAYQEGADFIIGPLLKTEASIVAELPHPVPTLLLNEPTNKLEDDNVFIFGLSPKLEAKQLAVHVAQQGYAHALIIALAGSFGDELIHSFNEQWSIMGGQIVDTLRFSNTSNLHHDIRTILKIQGPDYVNNARQKMMPLHPRKDIDVIILLAYPTKAREIKPILNYYYAGQIPVYATSIVYGGSLNTMKDRDLNDIIFCDIPWIFDHHMGSRAWPEAFNSYNRLYALGVDAFHLMTRLNTLLMFPAIYTDNGLFYLAHQSIHRVLWFGQFKQGAPVVLSTAQHL